MAAASSCQKLARPADAAKSVARRLTRVARPKATDQGFLQQHFFRDQQPVMDHARVNGAAQLIRGAGLRQEAEDLSLVHRRDRGVASRLPGEQNARCFRIQLSDMLEQRRTVHTRHAHVRDDDGGRAFVFEELQGAVAAVGGEHLVVAAQLHRQAFDDSGLVVHTEDAGKFFAVHGCAVVKTISLA
jgi:hypothetical protein